MAANPATYKPPEEKPVLVDGSFISDLVAKKPEIKSSNSRRGSLENAPAGGDTSLGGSYLRNYNDSCSLNDLPSGSTEADFGIVKEELHIEDIEEGAEYSCLASHSSIPDNLFSSSLPESLDPYVKGNYVIRYFPHLFEMGKNCC